MPAHHKFNPHPAIKFFALIFYGALFLHPISDVYNVLTVALFSMFFALNGRLATGIRMLLIYLFFIFLTETVDFSGLPDVIKILLSTIAIFKMFFIPFLAGKFLIATSDVGSIITTLDYMRMPQFVSIPLAVIFRFFPAYRVERRNIKLAMKMRGITHKNPLRYLEYVSVPLLISSSNIAEDISRAAETKCIAYPCKKVRYTAVRFKPVDAFFVFLLILVQLGGRLYA